MEGQANEGGEVQQKEESSKRHTYPLIRVNKNIFYIISKTFVLKYNFYFYRIVICMMK